MFNDNKYNSCYLIGATGPTGPRGIKGNNGSSDTLEFRNVMTSNPGTYASVIDVTGSPHHVIDLIIPRGVDGKEGPTGPKGPAGNSVKILGKYNSKEELIKDHQTGNIGDAYLVDGDLYVWSDNTKVWEDVGRIQGPEGPIGNTGATGPTGPEGPQAISRSSYLVLFNNGISEDGILVTPNNRIPFDRKEIDRTNLVNLNDDNTINFKTIGYYKISFIVSAYTRATDVIFNPHRDFVALGFRKINSDDVYIGASEWIYDETATQIMAHGILSVENTNNSYELVNLGNYDIYLNTPDLNDINSNSYFSNSLVTLIIEYLGKQDI